MPTPMIVGGQGLPPDSITQSSTNFLTPSMPSAGTSIFRKDMFSEPEPFGIISKSRYSASSAKSQWMTGMR